MWFSFVLLLLQISVMSPLSTANGSRCSHSLSALVDYLCGNAVPIFEWLGLCVDFMAQSTAYGLATALGAPSEFRVVHCFLALHIEPLWCIGLCLLMNSLNSTAYLYLLVYQDPSLMYHVW
jgi:hypothetical protein